MSGTEFEEFSEAVSINDDVDIVKAKSGVHLGCSTKQWLKRVLGRPCGIDIVGITGLIFRERYWEGTIMPYRDGPWK